MERMLRHVLCWWLEVELELKKESESIRIEGRNILV